MPSYTERPAGIFRAKYLGCVEKTFTDQDSGEETTRWLWRFQDVNDPLSTGELAKFTNMSLKSPNSNAYKIASGIVGRKLQPGDDTENFIGEIYDVVYGPNQAGNLTITSVVKVTPLAVSVTTENVTTLPMTSLPELP